MKKTKVVLAGASGYLGSHVAQALFEAGYDTTLIVRKSENAHFDSKKFTVVTAEVTKPDTLRGIMEGADTVITTVGITRQKEGVTYMDVDYQANANLLHEALKHKVRRFIYISVLNGDKLKELKICQAKEKFVNELQNSAIYYCVVRPNGYFSDMNDFIDMARKGRIYLFGNGKTKMNPIHGADLANVCVNAITASLHEITVGGPDTYTQDEIARLTFKALDKQPKITHIPDWVRRFIIWFLRKFTSQTFYGPLEFFLTILGMDMIAPQVGTHHLAAFLQEQVRANAKN